MRIPLANELGNQVERAPQGGIVVANDGGIGSALQGLGRTLQDATVQQLDIEKQKADLAQRASGALALAKTNNDLHDLHDQVAQGVATGSIDADKASAAFEAGVSKLKDSMLQSLPEDQRVAIDASITSTTGALQRNLNNVVIKRRESEVGATIDEFGAQVARDAMRIGPAAAAEKYDAVVDFAGDGAGWSPEARAAKKQASRQNITYGYYDQLSANQHASGDLDGINKALEEVQGAGGDDMTAVQRASTTNRLVGYRSSIMAQQERAANDAERERIARENAAAEAYNQAAQIMAKGAYLSQATIDSVSQATAGTSIEKQALALLSSQSSIAGFASKTAAQRAAELEHYRSEGANPAVGTSPENQKSIEMLAGIDSAANAAAKDNPWKAAQTYGVIKNSDVMNASDPGELLPILDRRMQQIGAVEAWTGRKVSPLQPVEAAQVGAILKNLPPAQSASLLSTMGSMLHDPDRIEAVAAQVGDGAAESKTLGQAMILAGDQTNDGRLKAEVLLRGAQALKDRTSMEDTSRQTGWRATIASEIRGAYPSSLAENDAIDIAYKMSAALDGDTDAAIKMATGGIIKHGNADAKIPLPDGMSERAFNKKINALTTIDFQSQAKDGYAYVSGMKMPLNKFVTSLPDASLVYAGNNNYAVKAGNSYVTNQKGVRLLIQVNP